MTRTSRSDRATIRQRRPERARPDHHADDHAKRGNEHRYHRDVGHDAAGNHRVKDPVCGMSVDPHTAKHQGRARRAAVLLLLGGLPESSLADPASISTQRSQPRSASRSRRARSTPARCTREIRQVGPGSCPICGMALEPVLVTRRGGAQSRARRHDAPVLDRPRAVAPGGRAGDGRAPDRA